jgi:xanthine dehydrogenase accessory factor
LEKEGIAREQLMRVHAPVGLDIGAITPEEIAVAIVAELIAIRRGAELAVPKMRRLTDAIFERWAQEHTSSEEAQDLARD